MKTLSLLRGLASFYPVRLREKGDFGGLMCGKLPSEVHTILLCLDYDDEVYPEALKLHPDLIITHHPFIFGAKHAVLESDPVKKNLYERTEKAGLAVYSFHTNFDTGTPGMNDALAERLGLLDAKPLEGCPMARGGRLPMPLPVKDFALYAKKKLGVSYGLLIAAGKPVVETVALIGGGGWRENELAQQLGYDIYISGDIPHHGRREIVLRHYDYLDLPHEIEKVFMPRMRQTILSLDPTLEVETIDHEKLPEVI
jgi:dinuclear metal center YbgI/SA1388 family protein